MKDTEFAYAVARVRSNENKLISSVGIESLINASDYKEALKILSELGYANIDTLDEEAVLSSVLKDAFELIYESAPDKKCLDFLIVRNDFHNIKTLIKSMVARRSSEGLLLSPSVIHADIIKKALETKEYSLLPELFSQTVKEAYELIISTMDGQKLEVFLDKKSLEACIYLAKESRDEFSVSIASLICAITDIKIAMRCLKTGKDADFIMSALAECDKVDTQRLCEAVLGGTESLCEYVSFLGYTNLSESLMNGYGSFEKACDDMIMIRVRDAKYKCLGIAPLVAYYFAVDAEVKTVRIILSCKKNGISNDNIMERVRVLYV